MPTYFGIPPKVKQTYTSFGETEYIGITEHGTSDDDEKWVIVKFIYNGSEQLIEITVAESSVDYKFKWSDRETYNYG